MRADGRDLVEGSVLDPDEAMADAERGLGDDRQRVLVQQVVRLVDRAGERALDRQDAEVDLPLDGRFGDGEEARQRLEGGSLREESLARGRTVGAVPTGIGDCDRFVEQIGRASCRERV